MTPGSSCSCRYLVWCAWRSWCRNGRSVFPSPLDLYWRWLPLFGECCLDCLLFPMLRSINLPWNDWTFQIGGQYMRIQTQMVNISWCSFYEYSRKSPPWAIEISNIQHKTSTEWRCFYPSPRKAKWCLLLPIPRICPVLLQSWSFLLILACLSSQCLALRYFIFKLLYIKWLTKGGIFFLRFLKRVLLTLCLENWTLGKWR